MKSITLKTRDCRNKKNIQNECCIYQIKLINFIKIQQTINLDVLLTEKIFTTTKLNYLKIVLMKFRIFKVIKKIYLAKNINLL